MKAQVKRMMSVAIALLSLSLAHRPAQGQTMVTAYSGDAYALHADILALPTLSVAATGSLPKAGGNLSAEVATLNNNTGVTGGVPGVPIFNGVKLATGLLHANTQGGNNVAHSFAGVNNLDIGVYSANILLLNLTADVVEATTDVTVGSTTGTSTITNLKINGNTVAVTGLANQTLSLVGAGNLKLGTLTLNEQKDLSTLNKPELIVNALDLQLSPSLFGSTDVAQIIVGHAHSGLQLANVGAVPEPGSVAALCGMAISGGWLVGRKRLRTRVRECVKRFVSTPANDHCQHSEKAESIPYLWQGLPVSGAKRRAQSEARLLQTPTYLLLSPLSRRGVALA